MTNRDETLEWWIATRPVRGKRAQRTYQRNVAAKINARIRWREDMATDPPAHYNRPGAEWNIQNDAEDVGVEQVAAPFPNLVMRFSDGRTWWDEVRVLQYVFPNVDDSCKTEDEDIK